VQRIGTEADVLFYKHIFQVFPPTEQAEIRSSYPTYGHIAAINISMQSGVNKSRILVAHHREHQVKCPACLGWKGHFTVELLTLRQ
jgi:hypothetical protein